MSLEHLEPIEAREKREKQPWDYSHVPLPTSWYGLPLLFASVANPQLESASFRASNSNGNRRSDLFASSVSYSTLITIDHWAGSAVGLSEKGWQKNVDEYVMTWLCTLRKYWASCTNGEVNGVVLSLTCKQWMICAWRRMEMNGAHMRSSMTEKQKCRAEARFPWISHISQPAQHASWHPNRWPSLKPNTWLPCSWNASLMKKMSSGASPCIFFSISAWPQPKSTAIHSGWPPRYPLHVSPSGRRQPSRHRCSQSAQRPRCAELEQHMSEVKMTKNIQKSFLLIIEVWITDSIWIIFVHLPFRILWGVFFSSTHRACNLLAKQAAQHSKKCQGWHRLDGVMMSEDELHSDED